MANFDTFLPMLLQFEGGYVNNTSDPGGETNKGVTMAVFQTVALPLLSIQPTSENLKALTDEQAGIIYKSKYWNPMQGDAFPMQELANIVCDFYVNSGTHATSLLQTVMGSMGAKVAVDGVFGPQSLQALLPLDQVTVYRHYKQGRIDYYQQLGVKYPMFLKGWLNRVNAFPNL